jgi:hypothetical protein
LNGRDSADHPLQRLAQRIDLALLAVGGQIAGEDLAVVLQRGVAGEDEHVTGAAHLVGRVLLAQAAFGGDEIGDLRGARAQCRGDLVTDPVALVAGVRGERNAWASSIARRTSATEALRHRTHERACVGIEDMHSCAVGADAAIPTDAQAHRDSAGS